MAINRQHRVWLTISSATGLCLLVLAALRTGPIELLTVLWAFATYAVLITLVVNRPGLADGVSAVRVLLGASALVSGACFGNGTLEVILFSAAIASDAIDGWLARRVGVTDHGAVLDMEADQLLVVLLAVAILDTCPLGSLPLLLPALKYLFVIANGVLKLPQGETKPVNGSNYRARWIYAVVLLALYSGLPMFRAPALSSTLLALAVPALMLSFTLDLRHQWQRSRCQPAG